MATSSAADVIERTWLAWALEHPAEPAPIEAALARVGEHYQEVLVDPLVREAVVGRRTGLALWDRGDSSPTHIYKRGDYQNAGRLVGPAGQPAKPTL